MALLAASSLAQTNAPPKERRNTVSEEVLLAKIPQLLVKRDDLVKRGWAKPDQRTDKKGVHFGKSNYSFAGIQGEVGFLYEQDSLAYFSFYTNGSDEDFTALYQFLCKTLNSKGERSGDAKSSEIKWEVIGKSIRYEVTLTHQMFGKEIERGFDIILHPKKQPNV
jgi:hypothetical protein